MKVAKLRYFLNPHQIEVRNLVYTQLIVLSWKVAIMSSSYHSSIGLQSFNKLVESQRFYVDKTDIIYDLICQGSGYFLTRPRYFGKSLLLSTIEAVFSGDRELFRGLYIGKSDFDFVKHPVVKVSFSAHDFSCINSFSEYFTVIINELAEQYEIEVTNGHYLLQFRSLIVQLYRKTGQRVVVLVDEYDRPVVNHMFNDNLDEISAQLRAFYALLSDLDEYLRFVFIVGESKLAQTTVFNAMNSVVDITTDLQFSALCGFTQAELEGFYRRDIDVLVNEMQLSEAQLLAQIKLWYRGYCFHHEAVSVYNPFTLLSLFHFKEFRCFGSNSRTPTLILDLLQQQSFQLQTLTQFAVGESVFGPVEPESFAIIPLMVQGGYLTIQSFEDGLFHLTFANLAVKKAFFISVVSHYGRLEVGRCEAQIVQLIQHIKSHQLEAFFDSFSHFFDHTISRQVNYYQSLFYGIFTLVGFTMPVEINICEAHIECAFPTDTITYVVALQINGTKEEALSLIDTDRYRHFNRQVVLLGASFDLRSHSIGEFEMHQM